MTSESETHNLFERARLGDAESIATLLEQYRHYLRLVARTQVHGTLAAKFDASDLVQETFLKAHRDFPDFCGNSQSELVGWLRKILACTISNSSRKYESTHRRNIRLECSAHSGLDRSANSLAADQSSPSERAMRREDEILVGTAIEQLPEDYREVLVLRHIKGLSFPEVAKHMGRSVDSVKHLWARALAQLRRSFPDRDGS